MSVHDDIPLLERALSGKSIELGSDTGYLVYTNALCASIA